MKDLTPMMKQYMNIKNKYKDCILFFRLGDFYEMFFDDAVLASKELEITLTQREIGNKKKAPMCGVPYHAADSYISKLIKKGYKVAICEQLEDPSVAKGIVERDVIRVITPGTITDLKALDEKSNNFLSSVYIGNRGAGVSYVDISTGEFYTTQYFGNINDSLSFVIDELGKISPSELMISERLFQNEKAMKIIENNINPHIEVYKETRFNLNDCKDKIESHFGNGSIKKFNLDNKDYSIISICILLSYLFDTQKTSLEHINKIFLYSVKNYMFLDINTRVNLEINETIRGKEKKGSLMWLLDDTSTAMGGRLLKKWLEQPLLTKEKIEYRLEIVENFVEDIILMDEVKEALKNIYDLERIMGKITYGSCNARDLISLKNSLNSLPKLKKILTNSGSKRLIDIGSKIDTLDDIFHLINDSIVEEPPISVREGGIIKTEFNEELKEFREAAIKGKEWLANLEEREKKKTGIKTLKVSFNRVFGYFIEVSKSYLKLVPENYIRKQTLANSERYFIPELKEMEAKILGAEERMVDLEYNIFVEIRNKIKNEIERIQKVSKIVSKIDVLNSFAQVAYKNDYVKPDLNDDGIIDIKNGRHPVVEKMLEENTFVANDTYLDTNKNRTMLITGPNMAGKSTYMRQVALITLMAQVGSFIPAESGNIGIVDRIFTRIGASDNLAQGESTFMVEMNEVSNIIQNATENSLIILDEVGRGTSTFDGLSIAWAVIEYINENIKAKTLFATHYHELTQLEGKLEGIKNYTILIEEKGEEITFLRKIDKGSTNKSYGIEVARLAGINKDIINRAGEILDSIEGNKEVKNSAEVKDEVNNKIREEELEQLDLFQYKGENLINKLKNLDVIKLTPMDAMNILYNIVEEAKDL